MRSYFSIFVFVVAAVLCSCHSGGTKTNQDDHLIAVEDSDEYMLSYGVDPSHEVPCPEFETIEEAEIVFAQSGLNYCFCDFIANNPSTMDYPFSTLQDCENMPVTIADSPDKTIRVYGWDNHLGGTCISWSAMYQICDNGKVYTYEGLPDWRYDAHLVTAIYKLPHPTRHLYLFDTYFREWSSLSYIGFVAYERIGHELKRVKILRNEDGELDDEIGFEYCVPEFYYNFASTLSWDYLYDFDVDQSILYFPLARTDQYTYMTDRFVRYQWNGASLEPTDTVPNQHLHESVRDYVVCYAHTSAGIVQFRVDSLADGRFRYTAWDKGLPIFEEPNIVLYGERKGDEFYFYNPPTYTYVAKIDAIPEVRVYYGDSTNRLKELSGVYSDK